MRLSKSQINKLGERLRKGNRSKRDLEMLDEFRYSFDDAYTRFSSMIERLLEYNFNSVKFTDREIKTRQSITEKLIREKTRLSEMQDIRGCRIVLADLTMVETMVNQIRLKIKESDFLIKKTDIRNDKVGYRAIHVIVIVDKKPIEIQIRTNLQDIWANLCEQYSSKDNNLKYGNTNEDVKNKLKSFSNTIDKIEKIEKRMKSINLWAKGNKIKEYLMIKKEIKSLREKVTVQLLNEIQ